MSSIVPLGTVANVRNGYAFASSDFQAEGVPVVRMSDLKDQVVDIEGAAKVPSYFLDEFQHYRISKGDLVIGMSGSIGKVAVYVSDKPALQNQRIGVFQVRDASKLDQGYLKFFSLTIEARLLKLGKGVAVKNISSKEIEALQIPLPPLPEQKHIAAILAKADRLRRLRRTARDLSDTYLQSVFLEMFGDRSTLKTRKLGELLLDNPKNGLYLPAEKYGSGTPIIRINNFYGGVLGNAEQFKRVQATPQETEEFAVVNGEILINRVNSLEYLGKCALVQGLTETTLFESNMMRLRVYEDIVLPIYLVRFLTTQQAYLQIIQHARKAVNQASINQQDVKSLVVPVPPLHLQQQFARIVHKFERLRAQQREAQRQAEHLFQTLLHRAFRGELGDPKGFGNP